MDRNVELFLNIEKALKEVFFVTTHRNGNLLILTFSFPDAEISNLALKKF